MKVTENEKKGIAAEQSDFQVAPCLCGVPIFTFILMLIFSAGLSFFACGGPYVGWIRLVLAAGFAAYADFISDSRLPLLAPVVGAVLGAVIFYPCLPIWPLSAAVLGYFISATARGRVQKNTAIVVCSAAIIIFAGLHFVGVAALSGELSVAKTISVAVEPYTQMKEILIYNRDYLAESGFEIDGVTISAMKNLILRTLPAAVIICGLLISWLSFAAFYSLIRFFTPKAVVCGRGITMSTTAAVVFVATYLIALFFGSYENSVIVLASENISVILIPGFFIVGISAMISAVKERTSGAALMFYIISTVFILMISMGGAMIIFAAIGVFFTLRRRYQRYVSKREDD